MSDEGIIGDPMTSIEVIEAMRNMARMSRAYRDELVAEGFTPEQAWELLKVWQHAVAGGKTAA